MRNPVLLVIASLSFTFFAAAYPSYGSHRTRDVTVTQPGRVISYPAPDPDNGLKKIPGTSKQPRLAIHVDIATVDAAHPFVAPGPDDLRGPCRE